MDWISFGVGAIAALSLLAALFVAYFWRLLFGTAKDFAAREDTFRR